MGLLPSKQRLRGLDTQSVLLATNPPEMMKKRTLTRRNRDEPGEENKHAEKRVGGLGAVPEGGALPGDPSAGLGAGDVPKRVGKREESLWRDYLCLYGVELLLYSVF